MFTALVHNLYKQNGGIFKRYRRYQKNPETAVQPYSTSELNSCARSGSCCARLGASSLSSRGDATLHASPIQVEIPKRGRTKRISTNHPNSSSTNSTASELNPRISISISLSGDQWGVRNNTSTRLRIVSSIMPWSLVSCPSAPRTHCMAYCCVRATLAL